MNFVVQEHFPAHPLFDLSNDHFSPKWLRQTLPSRWMQVGSSCYMLELWLGFCAYPAKQLNVKYFSDQSAAQDGILLKYLLLVSYITLF